MDSNFIKRECWHTHTYTVGQPRFDNGGSLFPFTRANAQWVIQGLK